MIENVDNKSLDLPPKWANRLLKWYCDPSLVEEIEGDLFETYKETKAKKGLKIARLTYSLNVIRFIQPFTLKKRWEQQRPNNFAMLMMLAFTFDQILEMCSKEFKTLLKKYRLKSNIWEKMRFYFQDYLIKSWDFLLGFLIKIADGPIELKINTS